MKKLLAIILVVALSLGLVGCSGSGSNIINLHEVVSDTPDKKLADFEVIENTCYGCILVDETTNVMYYYITTNCGGITPLYNADGTLKLYDPTEKGGGE